MKEQPEDEKGEFPFSEGRKGRGGKRKKSRKGRRGGRK